MRPSRIVLSTVLLGLVFAGCGGSDSLETSPDSALVIVDSDGAFDDIKAIVYLLEQPDVDILALTFSGTGIAHCPEAAANSAALLERIEAPDIPVACGRTTPLQGDNQAPQAWRDSADTLGGVTLPEPRDYSEDGAADLLTETIERADRNVTLVALGPLTNVAAFTLDELAHPYTGIRGIEGEKVNMHDVGHNKSFGGVSAMPESR